MTLREKIEQEARKYSKRFSSTGNPHFDIATQDMRNWSFSDGAVFGYRVAIKDAAEKLDASAEHHFKIDAGPEWDGMRHEVGCDDHDIDHALPGYAAHVIEQMARVIRSLEEWG